MTSAAGLRKAQILKCEPGNQLLPSKGEDDENMQAGCRSAGLGTIFKLKASKEWQLGFW